MKLEQLDIDKYEKSLKEIKVIESRITSRITEILKEVILKCFKNELDWWDYYGDSGERYPDNGNLSENWGDTISLYIEIKNKKGYNIICDYVDLISSFPKKYLTMDNEIIIKEINDIVEKDVAEQAIKKEKAKLAKQAKEKKKQEVMAKLSDEDKELLGLK